jgi:hypothetical protein
MAGVNDGKPFRFDQLADLGITRDQLRRMLREGEVRRVLHRVYVGGESLDDRDLRVASLRLVLPKDGVVCLDSAAWVLGVDTFAPSDRMNLVPSAMVRHGAVRVQGRGVRCIEGYLSSDDVMLVSGVPVTTPVRTVCDLLRRARRPWALAAADGMAHAGLIRPREVQAALAPLTGYPGIRQARELARLIEPATESSGESIQRLRLIDAGFPRPVPQYVVADTRGRELARLDNAYPAALVACEHDGVLHHTEPEDRSRDLARRSMLTDTRGWRFAVTTRATLFGRDDRFERAVGSMLGCRPRLPRQW